MIDLRYVPGASRRQVLRVGSLGLFGLNLPGLLRAEDENRSKGKEAKQRSCILLWLSGGISQLDSFDPKPDAPIEIRGEFSQSGVPPTSGVPPQHAHASRDCSPAEPRQSRGIEAAVGNNQ